MITQHRILPARLRRQRGGATPLLLLLLAAGIAITAFTSEGARMKSGAAQLKRATDAAAMAVTQAYAADDTIDAQALAEKYVYANLGMDATPLKNGLRLVLERVSSGDAKGFRVSATFHADADLLGSSADVTVASAAVATNKSLEVALALPNTLSEDGANLAALRRLGKDFAEQLVTGRNNAWLALVPYSQSVSVYDAADSSRIRRWAAPGALNPVELSSLFSSGYSGLADARMPDRRAKLLCMFRGLNQGDNYFWDEAPSSQFGIYYRADLPINDTNYGITPYTISWVGPNPSFGQATGANDTRTLIADRGCPSAPLLPLSNDLDQIGERLDAMSSRFNVNYAIAMGWSAMALAPAFRGSAGWGLADDLPRDFDDGDGDGIKAIVFLVNSTGQYWFDSDAYNAYVGQAIDGSAELGGFDYPVITRRFANLCASFRSRGLRFFLIVTGNDEEENENGDTIASASAFRRIAGTGLQGCAQEDGDLVYLSGADFTVSEARIKTRLDEIADDLRRQSNSVRLIE